jgi:hypothetical protein
MTATNNFGLTLLAANQSQKEVTVNQNAIQIDRVLQMNIISRTLTVAPTLPADGDKYIVGTAATGVWSGQDGNIAIYTTNGSTWSFVTPHAGWTAYSVADSALYVFSGTTWVVLGYIAAGSGLTDIAALSPVAGDLIVGNGTHWVLNTPLQAVGQTAAMMALIYG